MPKIKISRKFKYLKKQGNRLALYTQNPEEYPNGSTYFIGAHSNLIDIPNFEEGLYERHGEKWKEVIRKYKKDELLLIKLSSWTISKYRYFSHYDDKGNMFIFTNGTTSFTYLNTVLITEDDIVKS